MDIGRLWKTITEEFVSDAIVTIRPYEISAGVTGLMLELISPGFKDDEGNPVVFVWASKSFTNPFHLISTGQLFDLLIVGYRQMDYYFKLGNAHAPSVRRA